MSAHPLHLTNREEKLESDPMPVITTTTTTTVVVA